MYLLKKGGERMSIQKRLILSNIAMVLIPVLLFILAATILVTIFFGNEEGAWDFGHNMNNQGTAIVNKEFSRLKKVASLSPERLEDRYLLMVDQKLMDYKTSIIVRKGDEFTYSSTDLDKLTVNDLPEFGEEESQRPVQKIGDYHLRIQSYDFYYSDGTKGTIFLVRDAGTTVKFFPILFGLLLLILIGTNGLLTYFVSKSIIKPVNELMWAAQKISEGNLNFHIEAKKKDELGKLSQAFDHMRKKLKESTELQLQYEVNRKELISNISHDLKTPITSIKGYVEGILDGVANTPEKMNRYLKTIYSKSAYMDQLIDELDLYSRLDLNRLPFQFEEVDFKSFVGEVLEELKFDFEKDGVTLSFQIEKEPPYFVLIDQEKIKRVFVNIMNNSFKYMDKEDKQIHVSINEKGGYFVVQIQDNGPGIPEDAQPYIFDRFYRTEPSRNTKTGGSGLGLAIAKRIIEEHGGDIWVESKPEEGTGIFIKLKSL
jgi:histidine kinase